MTAATEHPIFKDGQPVEKSAARVYLGIKFPSAEALRALDMSQTGIVWVGIEQFYRDATDTTSTDDGVTVIIDAAGNRWKVISGTGGIQVNAAGTFAERDDFDEEEPPFAYYAIDTELLYVKEEGSGVWSAGFSIKGEDGVSIPITGTSTTSITPSAGNKVFTTQEARGWVAGQRLRAASDNGAIFAEGTVVSYSTDQLTIDVDRWQGDSAHADWNIGIAGEPGKAFSFYLTWDEDNTDSDPGAGEIKADDDDLSAATELYIDDLDRFGGSISAALLVASAVDNTVKADISLQSEGGNARADFIVDAVFDESGYVRYAIDDHSGATGFTVGTRILLTVRPRSNKGADGANGIDGATPGYPYNFDASTSMADPGLGDVRFDNATLASVTAIAISDFTASAGNPSIAGVLALVDQANAGIDRSRIRFKVRSAPANFVEFRVDAAVSNNTDWFEIPVAFVAGNGTITGSLDVEFVQSGEAGPAGTGAVDDVNGQTGSVLLEADDINTTSGGTFSGDNIEVVLDDHEDRIAGAEQDITDLETDKADKTITISAGTALTGGGDLSANRTLNIDKASTADVSAKTSNKVVTADVMFAPLDPSALSISTGNVAVNLATRRKFTLSFTAAAQLQFPTNCAVGDDYEIEITASTGTPAWTWQSGHIGDDYTSGSLPTINNVNTKRTRILCTVKSVSGSTATSVQVLLIAAEA